MPPRPLKVRWGAAFACVQFILDAGQEQTLAVFKKALDGNASKRPKKKRAKKSALEEALAGDLEESSPNCRWVDDLLCLAVAAP